MSSFRYVVLISSDGAPSKITKTVLSVLVTLCYFYVKYNAFSHKDSFLHFKMAAEAIDQIEP